MEKWLVGLLLLLSGRGMFANDEASPVGPCWVEAQFLVRSPVSARVLSDAREEIVRIWARYGVTIAWVTGVWTGPWRLVQIVLRDDRRREIQGARGLAWIEFLQPGLPRDLINVSVPATRDLVQRSVYLGRRIAELPPYTQDVLLARVIGRALAHELGHYLLASARHAHKGLMRASIGAEDFLSLEPRAFSLEPDEAATLVASGVARGVCQPAIAHR